MGVLKVPQRGQRLSSADIRQVFQCSVYGGMNRSLRTNTLVLISNHVKSIYDDRWIDGILHYTGMGQVGNQNLKSAQNRTLAESSANGIEVHLFEVFKPREYLYQGRVALAGPTYLERQPDSTGNDRDVVVFPLMLLDGDSPCLVSQSEYENFTRERERRVKRLSTEELRRRALRARQDPGKRDVKGTYYNRDENVAGYTKRRANGRCDLCGESAPFMHKNGDPYLESHHVVWLKHGGPDTIENTVALCPNCHRRMHILDSDGDKKRLIEKIKSYGG